MQRYKILKKTKLYSHKHEEGFLEKVLLPNGQENTYLISYTQEFVIVVPFLPGKKKVLMLEQYRHGVKRFTLGFPAGFVEKSESIIDAAKRELFEETGYEADSFEYVASLFENAGKSRKQFHIVFAYNAKGDNISDHVNLDTNESEALLQLFRVKDLFNVKNINKMASAVTVSVLQFIRLKLFVAS